MICIKINSSIDHNRADIMLSIHTYSIHTYSKFFLLSQDKFGEPKVFDDRLLVRCVFLPHAAEVAAHRLHRGDLRGLLRAAVSEGFQYLGLLHRGGIVLD